MLSVPVNTHVHTHAHAEENSGELNAVSIVEGETSKYGDEEVRLIDENGNEITPNLIPEREDRAVTFPSSYDLRDYDRVTVAKNQKLTGSCWAHAALASAESNMIINGLADTSIDLSEAHLVWFARGMYSTDTSDPLYMDGENLGTDAYDAGGNYRRSQATLARWSGVQLEANAPNVTTCPELSESQRYTSYGYLVNSNNYDISDTDSIKTHLMNDGALTISYYSTDYVYNDSADCYSDTYNSYYQTSVTEGTNHAVTLVGWDDNFSKSKFEGAVPAGNGAWICKNSWGENILDGGYFYMSYYEPTLASVASFEIASTDTYDSLYQYDGSVEITRSKSGESITAAHVYTAEQTETIKSVGFFTSEASVPYIVSIYADVEDGNPMSGTLLTTQKGEMTYAGYHTAELLESVTIEKGTKFSVVVALDKAGTLFYGDYCNISEGAAYYTYGVGTSDSYWYDDTKNFGNNFCIKAYTLNGIEINSENFPNTAFCNYVKSTWDSDGNGYLSDAEAAAAKTINVSGLGISDLTGIEYFTSVTTLNCSSNPLFALDLSANTAMTKLVTTGCSVSFSEVPCYGFSLTGLDVSKMSSVSGATVKNDAIYPTSTTITYNYDCGNGLTANLSLKLSGITHTLGSWSYSTASAHVRNCSYCTYSESGTHSFGAWSDNGDNHIHTCSICSGSETANHTYNAWTENANGTHSRSCSACGNVDSSSHSLSDWVNNGDGTHSRTCTDCSYTETASHGFGSWSDNGTNHIRYCESCDATETANHSYGNWTMINESQHAKICTSCGNTVTADHNFSKWSDNTDGTHSRSCSDCGYSETVEHAYGAWSDNKDGNHIHTCTDCGNVETVAHVWGEWTDNETNHQRECEVCHATETANHSYGNWTKINASQHAKTCTSCGNTVTADHNFSKWSDNTDGTHSRSCSDCGYIETVEHAYGAWSDNKDGNHIHTCTDCGNVETVAHVWGEWTDNETNHQRECEVCHAIETADHSYGDWTKINASQHAKICTSCGNTVTADHNFSKWTDNSDGTHSRSCYDCGYSETVEHAYGAWSDNKDGNHIHTCTDCGSVETVAHVWGEWTDNETNHQRECEVCHATETANHSYGDWTKSDENLHAKTCEDCGNTVSGEHNYGEWSDNGNAQQVHSCTDCGFRQIEDVAYTPGDLNRDGIIDIFDVVLARRGFIDGFADSTAEAATDVDGDGKLRIADIVKIQSFVAGKIDTFVG